jgi:transcriptional regulator with XRE-family HTH domain
LESIGKRFKHLRKMMKMSQVKFAQAIGISQGTLSDIEKDKFKPSIETVISASGYFNISTDWLLKGTGPGPGEVPVREKRQVELSPLEREILEKFRELDEEGKREVAHFVNYTHFEQAKKGRLSTSTSEQAAAKEYA